ERAVTWWKSARRRGEAVAIVEHRGDGKIKLHQPSMAGIGAASGALWGGLIGLIFFMPLVGMARRGAHCAGAGGDRGQGRAGDLEVRRARDPELAVQRAGERPARGTGPARRRRLASP